MLRDLKYQFIRTPLEAPLMWIRRVLEYPNRRRHPELSEIYLEDERIPAVLRRFVSSDANCVDIGCHYGSILSSFCRLAPRGGHVAFEAIPRKVQFLRRKFPDVDVREMALSDHSGSTEFYINRDATGFSGLARHGEGQFEKIRVACALLDDVLPRDRRFSFVKIDVEGAELFVLRGATQFMARDRPVILFECSPSGPPALGYQPGDVYDFMMDCGYAVFFLSDALRGGPQVSRTTFEAALVYPFKAFNWVALPDDARAARQ